MMMQAAVKAPTYEKIIRDPEFAKRLDSACEASGLCPPLHRGRLTWVQNELKRHFKETVSVETVRKWFAGEAKPRPEKVARLAQILQVDVSWLSLGIDKGMAPRELKARGREIDGAVNIVAGLIEMDGSHAAFASDSDQKRGVDIHAIIRGAKYDFHVTVGDEGVFRVPVKREGLVVLGLVKRGFTAEIYEISDTVIERHGSNKGGMVEVKLPPSRLKKIESFTERLG
jgi:transcriptional regulator with XRE-family HTH domain